MATQLLNALSPIDSSEAGSEAEPSAEQCSNARAPMVCSLLLNDTELSAVQYAKVSSPMVVRSSGSVMEESLVQL